MSTEPSLLSLSISSDVGKAVELLGLLPSQLKAALRTASRQTGQWANREGARGLAKAINVPLNVLKKGLRIKFRYKSVRGNGSASVWFGLNAIALQYLKVKQQGSGVKAGKIKYPGGFIVTKVGDNKPKQKSMIGKAYVRTGKARVPIKRLEYEINQQGVTFLENFSEQVGQKFVAAFFAQADKIQGRSAGESIAIVGTPKPA